MSFVYLSLFTLIIAALNRISVHSLLQQAILYFHQGCLNRIPIESLAREELQALVCAENFSTASKSTLYAATGLIHLFVVSGAHLLLLEKGLGQIIYKKKFNFLILFLLFIYCLACQLNPPVTRSFISIILSMILLKNHLNWPASFKILLTGVFTLVLNPPWAASVSLQLSWIAGLVVSINAIYFSKKSFFFKQSLYFILLTPLLLFICVPSALNILVNLIFTASLEFILFPLGILTWFFSFTYPIFDRLILGLNQILRPLEFQYVPQMDLKLNQMTYHGWLLILFLHFVLHLCEIQYRKKNYV